MRMACMGFLVFATAGWLVACSPVPAPATPLEDFASDRSAERIVSLVPSFTETLFAIGAGDRVVGVSAYCSHPAEAMALPKAGGYHDPNYEAIVMLKPDLVLLSSYREETAQRLARFGIATQSYPHGTLEEIVVSLRELGKLSGHETEARSIADAIAAKLAAVRAATANLPRQRVLLVVGRDVSDTSLREVYAAGPTGFLNELLHAAGAENALADSMAEYPILTAEGIIAVNPDRIFEIMDAPIKDSGAESNAMRAWEKLPHRDLLAEGRVHLFTGSHMNIPGPRMGQILDDFVAVLHPDLDMEAAP